MDGIHQKRFILINKEEEEEKKEEEEEEDHQDERLLPAHAHLWFKQLYLANLNKFNLEFSIFLHLPLSCWVGLCSNCQSPEPRGKYHSEVIIDPNHLDIGSF